MENRLSTIEQNVTDRHVDERRDLVAVFNGDFDAKQLKFATMNKDAILWWHYHNYREWFTIINGKATFNFYDIHDDNAWVKTIELTPWKKIVIPSQIAHEAFVQKWATLIWFTEEKYIDAATNDIPYDFNKIISRTQDDILNIFNTMKAE